jgi:hypothetical protein
MTPACRAWLRHALRRFCPRVQSKRRDPVVKSDRARRRGFTASAGARSALHAPSGSAGRSRRPRSYQATSALLIYLLYRSVKLRRLRSDQSSHPAACISMSSHVVLAHSEQKNLAAVRLSGDNDLSKHRYLILEFRPGRPVPRRAKPGAGRPAERARHGPAWSRFARLSLNIRLSSFRPAPGLRPRSVTPSRPT